MDPLIGRQLSGFRIERLLGQGGMAKVYFGWDNKLQRPVAIKVIAEQYRSDPAYVERFLREARIIASWYHPNILHVYSAGEEDGYYYFVMEYIRGQDLEQLLNQYRSAGRRISPGEVMRIGRAIASALDYAHGKGVIHRDVKPSNVIVAEDGRVVLADFGLAVQTTTGTMGQVFGSPHYIAPEQARSSSLAVPQSDLYSFGVILYEMLTGSVPFDDPSPTTLALQHITQEPPSPRYLNPEISPEVEAVLLKALRKSPTERYQTGHAFMDALEAGLQTGVTDTQPMTMRVLPGTPQPIHGTVSAYPANPAYAPPPPSGRARGYVADMPEPQPRYMPVASVPPAAPPAKPPSYRIFLTCGLIAGLLLLIAGAVFAMNLPGTPVGFWSATAEPTATFTQTITLTATVDAAATQTALVPTETPTLTVTLTPTVTETLIPSPTPTLEPTATLTPSETPTLAPTATVTPVPLVDYSLLLARRSDDSLFIVNEGESILPVLPLTLGDGDGQVEGEEFKVENLKPGECLRVYKNTGKVDTPRRLKCEEVGEIVRRAGNDRFWAREYKVYYNDEEIATCADKGERCEVEFTGVPSVP